MTPTDLILYMVVSAAIILIAVGCSTWTILSAISDARRDINNREIYDKTCDVERQIANLRWNIITCGDGYWLAKRLKEEAESRL